MYLILAYSKTHMSGSASSVDKDTIFMPSTFRSRAALLIALISTFGAPVPVILFVL